MTVVHRVAGRRVAGPWHVLALNCRLNPGSEIDSISPLGGVRFTFPINEDLGLMLRVLMSNEFRMKYYEAS